MDEMLTEERQIDEAIESYPLAPLPLDFTQRVMTQVQHTPQLDVTFRLQFIDLALPAFITTFVTAVSLTILWLTGYWEIEGSPTPNITISISELVGGLFESWVGWGLLLLLIEIVAGLIVATQVISDSPQVALQNGR